MTPGNRLTGTAHAAQALAAPERIHNWLDSQLSVARFYGGITFNGHSYTIAPNEPGCPLVRALVRADVLAREAKERKAAAKQARQTVVVQQGELL